MNIEELGWNSEFARHAAAYEGNDLVPARVIRESREPYLVLCEDGERLAETTGRFKHEASSRLDHPVAGDWIMIRKLEDGRAAIHALLPRSTAFVRKAAGTRTEPQVIASNISVAFLVSALDGGRNFNLRRIEREVTLAWESGAQPVIVLNKTDVCDDVENAMLSAEAVAPGASIIAASAVTGDGIDEIRALLPPGATGTMLGASGVGKSTLINRLTGDESQATAEIRDDDHRGRHTTTHRELIRIPGGGLIMDTPGLRELQLWVGEEAIDDAFNDIAELARQCRFRDCRHEGEPDCAVQKALAEGHLDSARFMSYLQLRKEQAYLARKTDIQAQLKEKAKWKSIAMWTKQIYKNRGKG